MPARIDLSLPYPCAQCPEVQPVIIAIETIAAYWGLCSRSWPNTIRTAQFRPRGSTFLFLSCPHPFNKRSPAIPGRFSPDAFHQLFRTRPRHRVPSSLVTQLARSRSLLSVTSSTRQRVMLTREHGLE